MKLYGICRTQNTCICGLCARIPEEGREQTPRRRKPKIVVPKPRISTAKPRPIASDCNCGLHDKPAPQPIRSTVDVPKRVTCGCIFYNGLRVKWCYGSHDPQTNPNPNP